MVGARSFCYDNNRDRTQMHDSDSGKSIQSQYLFVTRESIIVQGGKK